MKGRNAYNGQRRDRSPFASIGFSRSPQYTAWSSNCGSQLLNESRGPDYSNKEVGDNCLSPGRARFVGGGDDNIIAARAKRLPSRAVQMMVPVNPPPLRQFAQPHPPLCDRCRPSKSPRHERPSLMGLACRHLRPVRSCSPGGSLRSPQDGDADGDVIQGVRKIANWRVPPFMPGTTTVTASRSCLRHKEGIFSALFPPNHSAASGRLFFWSAGC